MTGFDAEWFWWICGWGAVLNNTWRPLSPRQSTGRSMRGGYSTWERTTVNFIKTNHVIAAIRKKLKEKLSYVTSSAHKEVSPGWRSKHDNIVRDLTNQLQDFFDPFLEAPAQHFKSGVQTEESIVDGLLKCQTIGECLLKGLIKDWIKAPSETKIILFDTIPLENIATGLK